MRPPITITNTNKYGKVTSKWFVRIGKKFKIFDQQAWEDGGIDWINMELTGGNK